MMIICITGQMAAGKNYIASQIVDGKFEVPGMEKNEVTSSLNLPWVSLDLDCVVHSAMEDKDVIQKIATAFGEKARLLGDELINGDGSVNRRVLGKVVFSEPGLLKTQEGIVYPYVIKTTKDFVTQNQEKNVIINATVLFKTPELLDMCDCVLFVKASYIKRLIRARRRDKMPLRQIMARFKAQKTLEEQYRLAGKPVITVKN